MYRDLNEFISALESREWLRRVADPISPNLEISALTDLASKSPGGGPALLFEKPRGHSIPVVTNLFGSYERMCLALGVESLDEIANEITKLTEPKPPTSVVDVIKMAPMVSRLADLMPKTVRGQCGKNW